MIELSDKEKQLFEDAKKFSLEKIEPYAAKWEKGLINSREAMNLFVEHGYCALGISEKFGGGDYSFLERVLIYEGLSHGDAALSSSQIQLHNNIVYTLAKYYENNKIVRDIFPSIVNGEKLLAFAITEEHSGSDPASMQSYAVLKDDGYHVYGKKAWIFNSLEADYFIIVVKNGTVDTKEMLMFLVDRETPGFEVSENIVRFGNNCISCCNLRFENCIISKERLLTDNGFRAALSFIDLPRTFVPAIAIGMAQRVIDITIDYLDNRISFNKPIIKNQGIQWNLADLLARVEAGRWIVYRTATMMDNKNPDKAQLAMNKLYTTQVAMDTKIKYLQFLGAKGYDRDSILSRYMAVAKLLQIVDGTSEIQKYVIGRDLMKRVLSQK